MLTFSLTVLCVTQISWFTSMVADAIFQGILCAGGPVCLGFAIDRTLNEMESLDQININAAVVIFLGLALALIQWLHLWIKVALVIAKCGGSSTVWKQSFCNLMDRNQPRDFSIDDFMIVNDVDGKRLSETEPIYGDAFDERAIETPPRLSISTFVEDKDWLRSKYTTNEKSPASTAPAVQYDPFPCTTMDFDVPVIDEPGSPIYTLPASYSNHRYSSSENLSAVASDENLPSLRYAPDSRRQSMQSFDGLSPRNSGEYQRPSFDIYRSNSGNSYRLVDGSRPASLNLHRVEAAVAQPVQPAAQTPSLQSQRPAFDLYQDQDDGHSELSHDHASTLYDHTAVPYDLASQFDRRRSPPSAPPAPRYDPTLSPRYADPPSHYEAGYEAHVPYDPLPPAQYGSQPPAPPAHYDQPQTRYDPPPRGSLYEPQSPAPYEPQPQHQPQAVPPRTGPSPRYGSPAAPRGSPSARPGRPKSYHGHAAHPPVARSKSYVDSPYQAAPPPSRSKSYGHGNSAHEPPQPGSRRASLDENGRRWSSSSYTSLPRVPSMLRHSEVLDGAVE